MKKCDGASMGKGKMGPKAGSFSAKLGKGGSKMGKGAAEGPAKK